ncbi:MAG: hypothetical protein ACOC9H_02880 [Gemmatimonadota bacterium]
MSESLYQKVGPRHRYSGELKGLLPLLRKRAWGIGMAFPPGPASDQRQAEDRDWAWVVLPRGALVGVRIRGELGMRNEVRIARDEAPETEEARGRWETELQVFYRHLGIEEVLDGDTPATTNHNSYLLEPPHPNDEGKAAVRLLELREGELAPMKARCHRCLTEDGGTVTYCRWNHVGVRGQRCAKHGGNDWDPDEWEV